MNIFYLVSIIIGLAIQSVAKKEYNRKSGRRGTMFFCGFTTLFAGVFFVITSGGLSWNTAQLPYSVGFAVAYGVAFFANTLAILWGSLSLTSLIVQYSLIMPTIFGIAFLDEPLGVGLIVGLLMLFISLLLINDGAKSSEPINGKWIVCVLLAFLGNGMCNIIQKLQQLEFSGEFKNEFMIIALIIVTVFFFAAAFARERGDFKVSAKNGLVLAIISGLVNGMVNLFVMILTGKMPVSIMFPLISAGGIVATYLISITVYKERLSKRQLAGFIIGIISIVLLNL